MKTDTNSLTLTDEVLSANCQLTAIGLEISGNCSREDWDRLGEFINRVDGGRMWWIGDWLLAGESGGYLTRGKYDEACERFGIEKKTAQHAVSICRSYESAMRMADLSFNHHQIVAGRDDRDELLRWAVLNKATTRELRMRKRDLEQPAPTLDDEPATDLSLTDALQKAARRKSVTTKELASWTGASKTSDINKALNALSQCSGMRVEPVNGSSWSIESDGSSSETIQRLFGELTPKQKMAVLKALNGDDDAVRIRGAKARSEQRNGMRQTEHAAETVHKALLTLDGFKSEYMSRPQWLSRGRKNEVDRAAVASVAHAVTLLRLRIDEISTFMKDKEHVYN